MAERNDQQPDAPASSRHQPQQVRSQETFEALLDAAARLYGEQGYEQTTTHQIAAAAGMSVGALYRYFDGKQTILEQLYRRQLTGLRQRALQAFTLTDLVGRDLSQLLRKTLRLALDAYGEQPGLYRVLGEQARKIPALSHLRRELEQEVHGTVRQILLAVPGATLPDPEVTAYLLSLFMESLLDDFALYRQGQDGPGFDQERVINAASDLVLRIVMAPGRPDAGA